MSEMDSNKQCQKKAKGRENANNGESETKEQNDPFDIEMCVNRKDGQERIVDFRTRSELDVMGQYIKKLERCKI